MSLSPLANSVDNDCMQGSRKNFFLILCSLLALRLIIGLHFYSEGITKIRDGNFSCAGFLSYAKGPFAESFAKLLDDPDGMMRLCVVEDPESGSPVFDRENPDSGQPQKKWVVDTESVCAYWKAYVDQATNHFGFNEKQRAEANIVLKQSQQHLTDYLTSYESEIVAWVAGKRRLKGFDRDGAAKTKTATWVDSLGGQIDTIKKDRSRDAGPWLAEVELTWDELEQRINQIAGVETPEDKFELARPYQPKGSPQHVIDSLLPWFDTVVGVLLILGLFTRFASLAGMGLLFGVVMTQPFWIPGVENTYYQWVELAGLLVLFATAAGQFGGLDYFFSRRKATDVSQE